MAGALFFPKGAPHPFQPSNRQPEHPYWADFTSTDISRAWFSISFYSYGLAVPKSSIQLLSVYAVL
ncbi:hypothetical protein AZA_01891 [Nitrospirillum viridazoti Y2]|nr:hypothetical protein AZA_01891 [Nitrospirillum amazonense Y2]